MSTIEAILKERLYVCLALFIGEVYSTIEAILAGIEWVKGHAS